MTVAQLQLLAPASAGQAVIRTERLVLRPLRRSDAGLIAHYTSDRRLAEGTRSIPHPLPPGAIDAWIARNGARAQPAEAADAANLGPTQVWVIDGAEADLAEVLGALSFTPVAEGQSELEFWIGPGFWNTGFATEAVAGLIAANPTGCTSFVAEAFQDNPGSARVLVNCGFRYIGDAESWSVARGARVPTWTYSRPA